MGCAYPSARDPGDNPPFRSSLHLGLPEPPFDLGLQAGQLSITPDLERDCVLVQILTPPHDDDIEVLLNPAAAIDTVLRLIGALDRLQGGVP